MLHFHLHNHTPTQWGIALSSTAQSVKNILKVVVNDIYCIYSESRRFYNEIPSLQLKDLQSTKMLRLQGESPLSTRLLLSRSSVESGSEQPVYNGHASHQVVTSVLQPSPFGHCVPPAIASRLKKQRLMIFSDILAPTWSGLDWSNMTPRQARWNMVSRPEIRLTRMTQALPSRC